MCGGECLFARRSQSATAVKAWEVGRRCYNAHSHCHLPNRSTRECPNHHPTIITHSLVPWPFPSRGCGCGCGSGLQTPNEPSSNRHRAGAATPIYLMPAAVISQSKLFFSLKICGALECFYFDFLLNFYRKLYMESVQILRHENFTDFST